MLDQRLRNLARGAMFAIPAAALTACGSDDVPQATAETSTQLTVAVSPGAATSTPMYLAVENGVFADLGLELNLTVLNDGTVAIPNTLNGQTEFSMSGFGPAAQAIEQGLGIKLVGAANVIPTDPDSRYQAVIVNRDKDITDMSQVEIWAADSTEVDPSQAFSVDALGGNYLDLQRVAVPFPAIGDAVADGTADAALVNEPFLSAALATGEVEVLAYVTGDLTKPGAPGAVFIGSEEYISANPEITERFMSGIQQAYQYAYDHPEEVAEYVPETGLNDQVPPVIALGEYQQGPLDPEKVDLLLDVFEQYGAIEGTQSGEDMVHQAS